MMSKTERDNVAAMVRGLEPLPKVLGVAILTPIFLGICFAIYAIVSTVRGEAFMEFAPKSVLVTVLVVLGVSILVRHRLDRLALKITGQYNEATLARGKLRVELSLMGRVKAFIPTLISWKGLLLLWVIANAFDCISTALALHYGAQEANPTAREASNMYLSKWIGVIALTAIAIYWQWKPAMKFLTTLMCLVVLSNFATLGMALVQPSLTEVERPDVTTSAFLIQLAEMAVIAVVILWGREIWSRLNGFYKQRVGRKNGIS